MILGHGEDLSAQLTVFVVSSGEPSLGLCLDHLKQQDCQFRVEHVRDVAPMWRAFQRMIDECKTPYYIQCDCDMLLQPWAVRALYDAVLKSADRVAMVCGWLWDEDVERPITGVKAYKYAVMQRYPYTDSFSCETTQLKRWEADGYKWTDVGAWDAPREKCLGLHYASQNAELAFRRWQRLAQKYRKYGYMSWLDAQFPRLIAVQHESTIAKWRALGIVSGLSGPLPDEAEMDAREANMDYLRLQRACGEWRQGPTSLVLYITDRCNHKCTFGGNPCRRNVDGGMQTSGDMELVLLQRVMEVHPTARTACIAGFGEPLLHPQLLDFVKAMVARSMNVGIVTNGSLLAKHANDLANTGVSNVNVSLNAATAEEHEAISHAKTWDAVLGGVRKAVGVGLPVGLSFVVTRKTVDKVPGMLALAKDLDVQFVHLHNVLPHGNPLDETFRSSVFITGSPELGALEACRSLRGAELVENWPQVLNPAHNPRRCDSPFTTLGFDARGWASPCRRIEPPDPEKSREHVTEAWMGAWFQQRRAEICGDKPLPEVCKWCFGNWRC